jgi:hypothetical protein
MSNLTRTADHLASVLESLGFIIMSKKAGHGLPLVAFRLPPKEGRNYDEFSLAHQLRSRGWVVPAYTMAAHTNQMKMLRIVVREDFSRSLCDTLIRDIKNSCATLEGLDEQEVQRHEEYVKKHITSNGKAGDGKNSVKVSCPSTSILPPFVVISLTALTRRSRTQCKPSMVRLTACVNGSTTQIRRVVSDGPDFMMIVWKCD